MKSITSILSLLALCLLVGCSDDDMEMQTVVDTEGPEIYESKWIDNPGIANDPDGQIENGGNYTISIESGFQILLSIQDISRVDSGEVYFLVNNDPTIREDIVVKRPFDIEEGSIGFVHRVTHISLGDGVFYELQPGDTYHFYVRFSDTVGNATEMSWTADLVE